MSWASNLKDLATGLSDVRHVTSQLSEVKAELRSLRDKQTDQAAEMAALREKITGCIERAVSEARSAVDLKLAMMFAQQQTQPTSQPKMLGSD